MWDRDNKFKVRCAFGIWCHHEFSTQDTSGTSLGWPASTYNVRGAGESDAAVESPRVSESLTVKGKPMGKETGDGKVLRGQVLRHSEVI